MLLVGEWLRNQVMPFGGTTIDVQLLTVQQMKDLTQQGAKSSLGVAFKEERFGYAMPTVRSVPRIGLLWGLPQTIFEGVVAHELGQAWLFVNELDSLDPSSAEGFCRLLSYLWYAQQHTPEAEKGWHKVQVE
jgi:hypothetical protein